MFVFSVSNTEYHILCNTLPLSAHEKLDLLEQMGDTCCKVVGWDVLETCRGMKRDTTSASKVHTITHC